MSITLSDDYFDHDGRMLTKVERKERRRQRERQRETARKRARQNEPPEINPYRAALDQYGERRYSPDSKTGKRIKRLEERAAEYDAKLEAEAEALRKREEREASPVHQKAREILDLWDPRDEIEAGYVETMKVSLEEGDYDTFHFNAGEIAEHRLSNMQSAANETSRAAQRAVANDAKTQADLERARAAKLMTEFES